MGYDMEITISIYLSYLVDIVSGMIILRLSLVMFTVKTETQDGG